MGELALHKGSHVPLETRRTPVSAVAIFLFLAAFFPTTTIAQTDTLSHEGFWIAFGVGGGIDLTASSSTSAGAGVGLRLGGTVTPALLVGTDVTVWARRQNNTTLSRGNLTAAIMVYPLQQGLYVKGGVGLAFASVETSSGNLAVTVSESGFGSTFGVGYESRIRRNLFLTGAIDVLVQVIHPDGAARTGTTSLALFTFGLTWH